MQEYLQSLTEAERAKVLAAFVELEEHGLRGAPVELRQIEGKLWELKVDAHRIFYVVIDGPMMVLLHACRKQGQKARKKDLEVAKARMKLLLEAMSSRR